MEQTKILLLFLASLAVVLSQRRQRLRVSTTGDINYDEPLASSSSSYETESFFPDIDWSDPFNDMAMGAIPEWGFKKTPAVSETPVNKMESSSLAAADRDGASRRLDVESRPYRRMSPGSGRKINTGGRPFNTNSGFDNYNRYDERYKALSSRTRTRDRFRPKVEQQNFNIPSNMETPKPHNLRVNSMRVSSARNEVNMDPRPGGLGMGLFGGGDIGGGREVTSSQEPPASPGLANLRVTTYRPANFLPITTYRPKTDSWARPGNLRKNNLPEKEIKIKDFVDNLYKVEAPIRPARWKPATTTADSLGSPYFTLEKKDFLAGEKEEAPVQRPSVFLPTMSSVEVEPSSQSILSFNPDFINEEEETIENVFIPTMVSTSTTENDDVRFSTSAARDAERRADQAYNQKKLQTNEEEKEETLSTVTGASDADNLRKWKKQLFIKNKPEGDSNENQSEELTTPKFVIDREFMQDRRRPPKFTTTFRPTVSEERNEYSSYSYVPTMKPLDNVQEGNAYAKTHLRNQKIKVESGDDVDQFQRVKPSTVELSPEEKLEGTKLISENGNNFGKTFFQSLKTRDGGKVDYLHLTMTDITKVIPINKLRSLLKKHGYTPSDIFNKNAAALEIAGKAMKTKNYFEQDSEPVLNNPPPPPSTTSKPRAEQKEPEAEEDDPYAGLNIDIVQWEDIKDNIKDEISASDHGFKSRADDGIKMPWPKRPKTKPTVSNGIKMPWPQRGNNEKESDDSNEGRRNNKPDKPSWTQKDRVSEERISSRKDSPRKINLASRKDEKGYGDVENDVIPAYKNLEEEIEKEASTMDFKSLVKKISPMSLSEVLSNVGFSLQDIMRGNKKAIKEVLKYHKKSLNPEAYKPKDASDPMTISAAENEEDFDEFVRTDPDVSDTTVENIPPAQSSTTTTTTTTTSAEQNSDARPAVELFKNCKACNRFFKTLRSSTTTTTGQPLRFGERTSKDTPTNIKQMKKRQRKPILPDPISKRLDLDGDDEEDEPTGENTTTPFSSLNFTLANLNMSENEVLEKKGLKVPGLDQLFGSLAKPEEKSDIIYGEKKPGEEKESSLRTDRTEPTRRKEPVKVYKNTDPFFNNGGGVRIRWNNANSYGGSSGGLYSGGGGGRLITNRKTTTRTTTRIPITYFGLEDELESSNPNDFLNGDYNGVNYEYDYESYDYYGPTHEVPSGVKSALIASSVVGGLAVSIFLCIFMLCLWKQMKSKLRMAGEYEDRSQGFLSSVFFKKSKKDIKKETTGYFNKVSPIGEQHYSTTSSEEY